MVLILPYKENPSKISVANQLTNCKHTSAAMVKHTRLWSLVLTGVVLLQGEWDHMSNHFDLLFVQTRTNLFWIHTVFFFFAFFFSNVDWSSLFWLVFKAQALCRDELQTKTIFKLNVFKTLKIMPLLMAKTYFFVV